MARAKIGTKRGPSKTKKGPSVIGKLDPPKLDPPKLDPGKLDPPKRDPGKLDPPKRDPLESPAIQKLADDIVQHHLAAEKQNVLVRAENGKRLLNAKSQLDHGDWGRFLVEKVPFSQKTAERAINLHHFKNANPARFEKLVPLGLIKADILISQPPAVFDALFANQPHLVPSLGVKLNLSRMSKSELLEVITQPDTVDAAEALVRTTTRSTRRLIRDLGTLVDRRDDLDLDRDEIVDLYDDLLHALSRLAKAYDLEPD